MRKDRGFWIALAIAIPAGVVLGFFFMLGPLFTDGPSSLVDPERLASLALTGAVYLAFATLLSWISRGDRIVLGVVGVPGIGLALWYTARETGVFGLTIAYVLAVVAAVALGRFLGLRLRRRGAAVQTNGS
ncbi:MAG: hypothetical protein QOC71_796 [Thermoplasmata archaeon]|nr:hypothetical protein [Thermoplasmata archaeon]